MRTLLQAFILATMLHSCAPKTTIIEGDITKIGTIKNGSKEKRWKFYLDERLFQAGNFKNDLENGKWKIFHPNGNLRQIGNFRNGKMIGLWHFYHPNKTLYGIANFNDGKFQGSCKWYFNNKQIHTIRNYENGKLISVDFARNRKGESIEKGTLINGNGTLIIYETEAEKDSIVEVIRYKDGEIAE